MAEQTAFTLPGVTVGAPVLTVNRKVTGSPAAEVIESLVLTQVIQVSDTTDNPNTSGYSTFTWTWRPPAGTATDDLSAALTAAGWAVNLPCLDPTRIYMITLN